MRILIIGSGGREHALAWKLSQEAEVLAAPGNPGIAQVARCFDVAANDFAGLEALCARENPDLVVIGPEDPLIAGLADRLRSLGIPVFGPGRDGAALEGSKALSKELMVEAGIRTAAHQTFLEPEAALHYSLQRIQEVGGVAVKASGAALGKGVVLCRTADEAEDAIQMMMVDQELGPAGSTVVVEDLLEGFEFSLLSLCNGEDFWSLPVAQDYKRALDGDRGPNTGGMGTYSPVPAVSVALVAQTEAEVVGPTLRALRARGIDYRGVLFTGLMVQGGQPYVLEYNVRFGDPETQSILLRIGSGLAAALLACALGQSIPEVSVLDHAAVTVVAASRGYPGAYRKGVPLSLPAPGEGVTIFHAGTNSAEGQLVTAGGRVLGVGAIGTDLAEARTRAYAWLEAADLEGLYYRRDIAAPEMLA